MSVKQSVQGVASGNIFVQKAEKLGSDICPHTRVPGRIKPELSPALMTVLFPSIILIQFMNSNFFVLEIVSVAAGVEGFLVLGFAMLKESFIAGEHIKSLVDIEGYIVSLTHPSSVLNTKSRTKYQSLGLTLLNVRSSCKVHDI